jgi:hypothetical protein
MRCLLSIFLMALIAKSAYAQDKELAIWTAASSSFELSERIYIDGALAFRSNAGLNTISRYFGEAGVGYKLSKSFSGIAGVRYGTLLDRSGGVQGNFTFYRLFTELKHKASWRQLRFKQRLRFQQDTEKKQGTLTENHLRYKTAIEFKIPNWKADPQVSVEFFKPLGSTSIHGFDRMRYKLQTDLNLAGNTLTLAYFIDRDTPLNTAPVNSHMLGLFYELDF